MLRPLPALTLAFLIAAPGLPARQAPADPPAAKPTRRALLVGVTKYPNLAERLWLQGPGNDVVLMKGLLMKEFAVPEANVVTLTEADGEARGAAFYPTRANIEREFKKLAEAAREGDEVVVLLGGHGSQQPEAPNAKDPEVDGLDEIFLPRDAGPWDGTAGTVKNAIVDEELGGWLQSVREKKAFVWLVIDACHSGTMMRGADDVERPRKADPDDLKIPTGAIRAAEDRAAKRGGGDRTRGGPAAKPTALGLSGKPGVFAVYAAQPTETTPERPMPMEGTERRQHGVLTFTICQVLTQARAAGVSVSYRELAQRVHSQYAAWGRTSPTPMVEYPDTDPDREVLGPGVWKDRSNVLLTERDGTYGITAGQLLGLTAGSVLEVRRPAGEKDEVLGHVKVTDPQLTKAAVEPVEFNGVPAPKLLPAGARCKVVFVEYGEVRLRLAVATHYPSAEKDLKPVPTDVRGPLAGRVKKAVRQDSLFQVVDDPKDAAPGGWLVTPHPDGAVSLLPASGWDPAKAPVKARGYGPAPAGDAFAEWLNDTVGRIARAQGLIDMARTGAQDLVQSDDLAPRMKVELVLLGPPGQPPRPLPWPAPDLAVYDKDRVQLRVTNTGRVPFDLTILYVDTDFAIHGGFPRGGTSNRVPPKGAITIGSTVNGQTVGSEHLVLIAVKGEGIETNFLSLAQKGPDKMRDVAVRGDGPSSRMARQFARRVFQLGGKEGTRGWGADTAGDQAMGLVTWQVHGTPRPKAEPKK